MIERTVLARLDAGCHEPVGVLSDIEGNCLKIRLVKDSATGIVRKIVQGDLNNWENLVDELTEDLTEDIKKENKEL